MDCFNIVFILKLIFQRWNYATHFSKIEAGNELILITIQAGAKTLPCKHNCIQANIYASISKSS